MEQETMYILIIIALCLNIVFIITNIVANILSIKPIPTLSDSLNSLYLTVESIDNEVKKIYNDKEKDKQK